MARIAKRAGKRAAGRTTSSRAVKRGPARAGAKQATRKGTSAPDPLRRVSPVDAALARQADQHVYGNRVKCKTDTRGFATPNNDGRVSIVVDASEGFIPLWAKNCTLRWRFQEQAMKVFANPTAAKARIRELMGKALLAWGDAVPIKFAERRDAWDFEVVVRAAEDCDINGCTLAAAFFPDAGRHELEIYPTMFEQGEQEQIETLAHEFGHVFGLRHFFANISEKRWKSEIFGRHSPFSIMNYGPKSRMKPADRADLRKLYQKVWAGELTAINGTRVKLVRPSHYD